MVPILIIVSIIAIAVVIGRERTRRPERQAGHARCPYCQTNLKQTANKMHYATACRKCGRAMPWAKQ